MSGTGREDRRVCVGAIAGAHGVRGDVRLKSFCAEPEAVASYGPLETEDASRRFEVRLTKAIKEGFGARLTGVATREDAEALKGTRLYVDRARLPSLPDDEFYHADLVGLEVRDTGGARLGRVRAIHDHGAGDLVEITAGPAAGAMIPFTRWAVPTVDLTAGVMIVDLPADAEEPEEEAEPSSATPADAAPGSGPVSTPGSTPGAVPGAPRPQAEAIDDDTT